MIVSAIELHQKKGTLFALMGLSMLLVLAACAPAQAFVTEPGQPLDQNPSRQDVRLAYVITVQDALEREGAVTAFNEATGEIIQRIDTDGLPNVVVNRDGDRLYLVEYKRSPELEQQIYTVSLVDTQTWKVLATTTFTDPMGRLVLTPDESRLYVSSAKVLDDYALDYRLSALDAKTLDILPTQIPLPGCGSAQLATARDQLIVQCYRANELRFIDLATNQVMATVEIPRAGLGVNPLSVEGRLSGFVVAPNEESVYVVTNDRRIVEISTLDHTILREVTAWRLRPRAVPVGAVGISRSGEHLIVGAVSSMQVENPALRLRVLELPDLTSVRSTKLPGYAGFASAPAGGVYIYPSGDTIVQRLSPDLTESTPLLELDGRVHQVLVPAERR